jgi:hypothetical protein
VCYFAGEYVEMRYLTDNRTTLVFDIPLAEVVTDYFDMLKSKSKVGVGGCKIVRTADLPMLDLNSYVGAGVESVQLCTCTHIALYLR